MTTIEKLEEIARLAEQAEAIIDSLAEHEDYNGMDLGVLMGSAFGFVAIAKREARYFVEWNKEQGNAQ